MRGFPIRALPSMVDMVLTASLVVGGGVAGRTRHGTGVVPKESATPGDSSTSPQSRPSSGPSRNSDDRLETVLLSAGGRCKLEAGPHSLDEHRSDRQANARTWRRGRTPLKSLG